MRNDSSRQGVKGGCDIHFSLSTHCGLKSLAYLATHPAGTFVPLREISDGVGTPRSYLINIFRMLKRESVLASLQGKGGGFALVDSPRRILVADLVDILEGKAALPDPVRRRKRTHLDSFVEEMFLESIGAMRAVLSQYTLEDLSRQI